MVIHINNNIVCVSDCTDLSKEIDICFNVYKYIALYFYEKIDITSGILGLITGKIKKIKDNLGRLVIIASHPDLNELLSTSKINRIVPSYNSLQHFEQNICNFEADMQHDQKPNPDHIESQY